MRSFKPRSLRILVSLVLLLSCLVWSHAPAFAHAGFVRGDPGSGETLSESPKRIRLTFNEPVEAEFDPVRVTGPSGERVDGEDARISPEDARVVEASLGELETGTYEVEYRVASVDGHVISGGYQFEVAAPVEETTQQGVETSTVEPTAVEPATQETTQQTLPETEPASEGSSPLGRYALVGLLVLGLAVAAAIATRRSRGRS